MNTGLKLFLGISICVTCLLLGLNRRNQSFHIFLNNESSVASQKKENDSNQTTIFVITPTKYRLEQRADLTRLSYALRLASNIYWIIVEDSPSKSNHLTNLLVRSKLPYTHLNIETDEEFIARGSTQRNLALKWLRDSYSEEDKNMPKNAVVFFADDDNTYDIRLFEMMKTIKKVGIWPVGFTGNGLVQSPRVYKNRVEGWITKFNPDKRKFNTDQAGFAVHIDLILENPNAYFRKNCLVGQSESCFLEELKVKIKDLEPLGFDGDYGKREILVWHTKTQKYEAKDLIKNYGFVI